MSKPHDPRTTEQRERDRAAWDAILRGPSPRDEVETSPGLSARELAETVYAWRFGYVNEADAEVVEALERCLRYDGGAH
jgi:hypothetical protein